MAPSFVLSVLLLLVACHLTESEITCRDENNNPVDWFIVYKLPRIPRHPDPLVSSGIGYFYMDSNDPKFRFGHRKLSTKNHAIANTLRDVYEKKDDPNVGYILYNDQLPDRNWSRTYGHTKGDLALDHNSGWWLVHSLPRFPPKAKDGYSLSSNAYYMGQSFLCLSLGVDEFEAVGQHLQYAFPWAYDFKIPDWVQKRFPHLWSVANLKPVDGAPFSHIGQIATKKGLSFKTFGKSTEWGKDLYHDLVAPSLRRPLDVQTWRTVFPGNEDETLPSNCSLPFPVYNVKEVDFKSPMNVSFSYLLDHSKWAITTQSNVGDSDSGNSFCIGGINRASSQFKRGGGVVCCQMPQIWSQFHGIISELEQCK